MVLHWFCFSTFQSRKVSEEPFLGFDWIVYGISIKNKVSIVVYRYNTYLHNKLPYTEEQQHTYMEYG